MKGKRRRERPYFFLKCAVQWRNQFFSSLVDWQATWHRRRFLPVFPQKCVPGKVEQPVKQHLDRATLKFSAENNTNELPRNSFQTMSKSDFPLRVTPMNPFKTVFRPNQTEILFSFHPRPITVQSEQQEPQWQRPHRICAWASLQRGISPQRAQEEITLCSHQRRFV